jgi:hypothetical protein
MLKKSKLILLVLDNSCLINCVELKSKDSGTQTQGKLVSICYNCGKIGHIRSNFYLLKSLRPWNKQIAPKKGNIEKPSFNKYAPPHRRHLSQEGKNFVLCKHVNLKIAEPVKKHFSKQSQPTSHHCGVTGHTRPHYHQIQHQKPRIKKQEPKTGKSSSKTSMPHHAFRKNPQRGSPSCRHYGKYGHTKAECFRVKPHKPKKNQIYEGLVNMMKSVLVRLNNLDMAYNSACQVNKVWVRKDVTIHPLRGSGLT